MPTSFQDAGHYPGTPNTIVPMPEGTGLTDQLAMVEPAAPARSKCWVLRIGCPDNPSSKTDGTKVGAGCLFEPAGSAIGPQGDTCKAAPCHAIPGAEPQACRVGHRGSPARRFRRLNKEITFS